MDSNNNQTPRKLAIGWFSFTCCEDSTILFTELLNKRFDEWSKVIEFRHVKALRTTNELKDLDVAFVEGAISGKSQEDEVKKIRDNAKYVVAIGACACTGRPSATRNDFVDQDITDEIQWHFDHFDYRKKVAKLSEIISVDDRVDGCPISVPKFLEIVNKYLNIFNIV